MGDQSHWALASRINVIERSPDKLVVKYRYHPLPEGRAWKLVFLGLFFIGAGMIGIAIGIPGILVGGITMAVLVFGLTWYYPRQCRTIVVDKKVGEISFSDTFSPTSQLPMSVPFRLVKGLTVASEAMVSKPEHFLSLTLHPAPQGPFSFPHFTHLLVKSHDASEIEKLARILSEFSDFHVIRQH